MLSIRSIKKLSEKEKIIQDQANQIEEKSERSQAEMTKKLEGTEAESSRAMKKLIEKQKIVQEQAKLIK